MFLVPGVVEGKAARSFSGTAASPPLALGAMYTPSAISDQAGYAAFDIIARLHSSYYPDRVDANGKNKYVHVLYSVWYGDSSSTCEATNSCLVRTYQFLIHITNTTTSCDGRSDCQVDPQGFTTCNLLCSTWNRTANSIYVTDKELVAYGPHPPTCSPAVGPASSDCVAYRAYYPPSPPPPADTAAIHGSDNVSGDDSPAEAELSSDSEQHAAAVLSAFDNLATRHEAAFPLVPRQMHVQHVHGDLAPKGELPKGIVDGAFDVALQL